ncbi:MAG: (d)CMP kinase, partial [Gemmatimonadetes bacterium]|nr:(d)CMP kinase [Gemmatimonadota bacterium]
MSALVVAIDGPAASGKSTTARRVAERLGFVYLDTGAMYRAITWKALAQGVDIDDDDALERLVAATELSWDERRIHVDGVDVTDEIRSPEVSRRVSVVSRASGVRRALVALQRRVAERGPCVVEGRDIGTVVFP